MMVKGKVNCFSQLEDTFVYRKKGSISEHQTRNLTFETRESGVTIIPTSCAITFILTAFYKGRDKTISKSKLRQVFVVYW